MDAKHCKNVLVMANLNLNLNLNHLIYIARVTKTKTGFKGIQGDQERSNGWDKNKRGAYVLPDRGGIRGPDSVHMLHTTKSGRVWDM